VAADATDIDRAVTASKIRAFPIAFSPYTDGGIAGLFTVRRRFPSDRAIEVEEYGEGWAI